MKEKELEKRIRLIEKEIDFQCTEMSDTKCALKSEIDKIKIEMEVLKRFIGEAHSGFNDSCVKIKECVLHEVNPEFI